MLHSKACVLRDLPFNLRREMGECPYDQGGYFVIDGAEKVIVSHEEKQKTSYTFLKVTIWITQCNIQHRLRVSPMILSNSSNNCCKCKSLYSK